MKKEQQMRLLRMMRSLDRFAAHVDMRAESVARLVMLMLLYACQQQQCGTHLLTSCCAVTAFPSFRFCRVLGALMMMALI